MVEASDKPPVTISVGFEHQGFDEVAHAETVARHLGCEFHALTASPRVEELLPKLAWHFDEPFADSSAVPTYYVSKAARELVTVALSGDGGDELWAGYTRHRVEHWEQRVRGALGPAARAAGWLGQALPLSVKGRAVAAPPRGESRSGLRAQARLRHVRAGREERGSIQATSAASVNGYDALATFRDAYHACGSQRSARSLDVRRRPDLHDRRRPDQGRSHEHGGLARGARAAARSQAARVRGAGAGRR